METIRTKAGKLIHVLEEDQGTIIRTATTADLATARAERTGSWIEEIDGKRRNLYLGIYLEEHDADGDLTGGFTTDIEIWVDVAEAA